MTSHGAWALALGDAGFLTIDRAGATWGVLAILLLLGCVILFLKSRYERAGYEHQRRLHSLYDLTEQVLAASDRNEVLAAVTKAAADVVRAHTGSVLIANGKTRQLDYVSSSDRSRRPN